jgi:hypothetical protein
MRKRVGALVLAMVVATAAACGDDGKVGAPGSAATDGPGEPRPSPDSRPLPLPEPDARARPGDVATWEVRVEGRPEVTTLTWRATRAADGGVETRVESRTAEASGRVLAETSSVVPFDAAPAPSGEVVSETTEAVAVGSRTLETARRALRVGEGEAVVWLSREVPFGGVVRAKTAGGVEQTLVSFRRGPPAGR